MKYKKIWSREYGVQYCECAMRCLGPEVKEYLPVVMPSCFLIPENGNETFCIDIKEFDKAIEILKDMRNRKDFDAFAVSFHKYGREYLEMSEKIHDIRFKELDNLELVDSFKEYIRIWDRYTAHLWIGYFLADLYAENGEEILKKHELKDEKARSSLFAPSKRVGVLELKDKLIKLKRDGLKRIPNNRMQELLKEYSWIPCLDFINSPWTEKDLEDFYEHLDNGEEEMSFNEAVKKAGLNKEEIEFFRQIKDASYIKDERDVYRRKSIYLSFAFFDEMAKRLGLNRKELTYLTTLEIIDSLNGKKIDKKEIKRRMKGFLIYRESIDSGRIIVNSEPKFVSEFIEKNVGSDKHDEIKGIIANKGIIRGRARIVTSVNDLSKVKKGDILVSITTHPDFVPAMQKAVAFITDEGGMMSHAAIVSREMNKPCIVGTKSATRILKNNEMIEINANEGIIRRLK